MIKINLQLFGGRGASSSASGGAGGSASNGAAGGTFSSLSEFEKSLTGYDDPRLSEYSNALELEEQQVNEINSLKQLASTEGLGEWTKIALETEKNDARSRLNNMPTNKTPAQLGESEGLKARIAALDNILSIKPSGASAIGEVDILV